MLPGTAGEQGWAGVLMPSVDRVGRYFPLTIALPLGEGPASTAQMTALWHWLARLDELAPEDLDKLPADEVGAGCVERMRSSWLRCIWAQTQLIVHNGTIDVGPRM